MSIRTIILSLALAAFGAHPVVAQTIRCDARAHAVSASGAFSLGTDNTHVNGVLAQTRPGEKAVTQAGYGVQGEVIVPLASSWGLSAGTRFYQNGVSRQGDAGDAPLPEDRRDAGTLRVRSYSVGAVNRFGRERRFCPYAGLAVGAYRFDYGGSRHTAAGGAGKLGFELPANNALGVIIDFEFDWILNYSRPPMRAKDIPMAWATAGFRYTF
jgi:hypothetical protein